MPWMMRRSTFEFFPATRCDHCSAAVEDVDHAVVAWPVDILADPRDESVSILCSENCLENLSADRSSDGEWIATPLAVYIANLVVGLQIDVAKVLETEQASVAAENTRDQAPD